MKKQDKMEFFYLENSWRKSATSFRLAPTCPTQKWEERLERLLSYFELEKDHHPFKDEYDIVKRK